MEESNLHKNMTLIMYYNAFFVVRPSRLLYPMGWYRKGQNGYYSAVSGLRGKKTKKYLKGDQIGRIFAYLVFVYSRQILFELVMTVLFGVYVCREKYVCTYLVGTT
jgi:hypothetical protein